MTNYRREGGPLHIKSYSANVHESEFAQSPSDFSSKLHIALKEANETMNWLNLLHDTGFLDDNGFNSFTYDCNEVIAMLVSSIKTIKKNNNIPLLYETLGKRL